MKIVIAMDSFKGCLTSRVAADAAATGMRRVMPTATFCCVPIADGGEGTVEALVCGTHGNMQTCAAHDPLMRPHTAQYGILGDQTTAVIELAAASGLPLVEPTLRDPRQTTTYGTGEVIRDALNRGCTAFILGLGGSATNDGGMGILAALGVRFYDAKNMDLAPMGANLIHVARMDFSGLDPRAAQAQFTVACDVTNPLFGPTGAAQIFARQKGADDAAIAQLDAGLRHYATVLERTTGRAVAHQPGAGAAGGVGAALFACFHAQLTSGIACVLERIRFDAVLDGTDLVVTGEGRLDGQSLMGKAPIGIARAAARKQIPVIALAGSVAADAAATHEQHIDAVFCIHREPLDLARAMEPDYAAAAIANTAEEIARLIQRLRPA